MEPEFSDTPEQDPALDQSRERVSAYDLMVMEGIDLAGLHQKKEEIRTIFDQIQDKASSVLELSLKWEEIDEQFGFLNQRAIEAEWKEASLREQTLKLEKKEERLKLVQEREREIEASIIERMSALEEKENESDLKLILEADVMRLVLQMQTEQVVVAQLNAQEKLLGLLQDSMLKKHEEVMRELEASKKDVSLLSKSVDNKSCELEMKVRDFDLKQTAETERRRKEAELMETSLKQLEARENELSLLNDTIKEKSTELEKKEENFLLKQQTIAREIEVKNKFLELKEKELEERKKDFELKQREIEERAIQAETRKRSRFESESSLLAEKGSDADQTLIRPGKKHKPNSTQHNHYDEDKEKDSAFVVSDSTSSPVQISEAHEGDIEEAVSIDDSDEDHEPLMCVDSEFNDFSKTMSSFMAGQVWALYDPRDDMPRCYGRIKRVIKSQSSLQVTWLDPKDEESDEESVPVACGRFKWGTTAIVKSHLTFSHEMHPIIHGKNFIAVNPRKGETWALFRDWSNSWNSNPEQHKPPYRYDFVEVLHNFNDHLGVGVAYLGKVDGFVSVFKQAGQHGVVSLMITPEEMHRFSHRVPSFRLNGEEKEGVPAGSFELDPAALPNSTLNHKTGDFEDQDGSRTDSPIILD